jgi:nitroimidazol reductase NimA-like FMN-containing flavoprotein (pyridoxamine 5'-phosphate oxidase superfamily)
MDENIREKIRALIREQGTCVLATASENRPPLFVDGLCY